MEIEGKTETLFDMSEYQNEAQVRKLRESDADKRLKQIEEMEEREFRNLKNKLNSGQTLTAAESKRLEGYRKKFMALSRKGLPDHVVTSKVKVAEHFGKTKQTIINWAHRGMPQLPNGYDLKEIEVWAIDEGLIKEKVLPSKPNRNKSSKDKDRSDLEKEKLKGDVELRKLQIAQKREQLVNAED